mmetsp:Transcript_24448/g.54442  ORF Transcript_24448/g.54442 Transcript_24448/m.54442 type:complete len:207 (+) Transcript_24448:141-761(+)
MPPDRARATPLQRNCVPLKAMMYCTSWYSSRGPGTAKRMRMARYRQTRTSGTSERRNKMQNTGSLMQPKMDLSKGKKWYSTKARRPRQEHRDGVVPIIARDCMSWKQRPLVSMPFLTSSTATSTSVSTSLHRSSTTTRIHLRSQRHMSGSSARALLRYSRRPCMACLRTGSAMEMRNTLALRRLRATAFFTRLHCCQMPRRMPRPV